MEIVKLIGADVLPDDQKLVIECARVIRLGFLQQNAYHATDSYVPLTKQMAMMDAIIFLYTRALALVEKGIPVARLKDTGVFDKFIRMKYDIENDKPEMFDEYKKMAEEAVNRTMSENL